MKKNTFILLFAALLIGGFTACKKSSSSPEEEDPDGNGNGGGNNKTAVYLEGSDYYLIAMDETTKDKINAKVNKDYRSDENLIKLNIWPGTGDSYTAGSPSGPNSFGEVQPWVSLVVNAPAGWSGFGFSPEATTVDFSGVTNDHVLHFAIKSKDDATHIIALTDGSGEYRVAIGASGFNDNGNITPAYTNFTRDGEWHHIEIPMSVFISKGLTYRSGGFTGGNIFYALSGSAKGVTLDLDAIFIYKPKK